MQPVVQATPCHSIKTRATDPVLQWLERMASSSSQPVAIFFPRAPLSCSWPPGTRGQAYCQTSHRLSTVRRPKSPKLETLSTIDTAMLRAPRAVHSEPVLSSKAESLTLLAHDPAPPTLACMPPLTPYLKYQDSPLPRSKDGHWDKL
uniref:Uncharacterized protein n=1 Tax=Cebus imitator TaxID=2715852 RepID=A0A2K5Q796_CEBIM